MIVLAILSLVWGVFQGLFGALPSGNLGLNTLAGNVVADGFFGHLAWFNNYVPVDAVVAGVGVLLTLFSVMLAVRIVLWVLAKLHITGGGGD